MKKFILLVILLVTVVLLSSCYDTIKNDVELATYNSNGVVDYTKAVKNHASIEIKTNNFTRMYMTDNLFSVKVLPNGTLEIVNLAYDVYLYSNDWEIRIYDFVEGDD